MAWTVERSAASDRDLELIFDFLHGVGLDLGEAAPDAFDRAAKRIQAIETAMERLGAVPFQGTLRPELGPGIRQATRDRAIFYFVLDEAAERLHVLAIFFGGQDHQRRMLLRLMTDNAP